MTRLLTADNLSVQFTLDEGVFTAVDDISFYIDRGEIVGLVGESGCGKSVTALSALRLLPAPIAEITNGDIRFQDQDLLTLSPREMRDIRGRDITMIFQEPGAALSPLYRVGDQMIEALKLHQKIDRKSAWSIAENWLERVGIPDAAERMTAYPYQLSGGMQQRIMIAMALMPDPVLIIADEPTTALDVTVQAQVFDLIQEMRKQNTAILLITHDMGVVWEMCDRVMVMYAAKIVEEGTKQEIFSNPAHPYTQGLLKSIPNFSGKQNRLHAIAGQVPSPFQYPTGCRFHDRCPHALAICKNEQPGFVSVGAGSKPAPVGHQAACFLL